MLSLTRQRSAAASGVVLVLRFGVGAVLNYSLGVVLAWMLTPSQFGSVSVLQNLLFLCSALLSAGFPWALTGIIAQAEARLGVDAAYRAALVGNLGFGAVLALVFVGAQITRGVVPGVSVATVAVIAATIAMTSVSTTLQGALHGERRFDGLSLMQTTGIGVKVALTLILVSLVRVRAGGAAAGFLAGAITATAVGAWALRDRLPRRGPMAWRATTSRALSMAIATSAVSLIMTTDVVALSLIGQRHGLSAGDIAVYQAAAVLARAPYFVAEALSSAIFPSIAKAETAAAVRSWFLAAYRWVPLALVPLQLILLVAPGTALALFFPAPYERAADLLRILAVGTLGLLTADMLLKTLYARGLTASLARRVPIALTVEVVALVVAVPRWGTTGAAAAFAVGSWTGAVLLGHLFASQYGASWPSRKVAMRYPLALAPLVVLLAAANVVPELPALAVIAVGLALYAVTAVRARLVRDEDVTRVSAVLRQLRPKRRAAQA
ncbi:polysaccharide biosynthesis C-terminal domain-containing protein [Dactylosporangium sp. NPDC048998]|uniref:oligosaccharide flippase family protein n=1 Tax=Dactylosporangium sp. NPDC048998 TaxID=3363976 RepID=UPI0037107794